MKMRFVTVVALLFACAFSARAETYVYIQSTQMSSSSTGGNTAWQCSSDRCWYLASDVMTDGVIDAEKLKTAAPAQISKPQPGDSVIFAAYQGGTTDKENNPYRNGETPDPGYIWQLYPNLHNTSVPLTVENMDVGFDSSFEFRTSSNNFSFITVNLEGKAGNHDNNIFTVNDTLSVTGGKNVRIYGYANTFVDDTLTKYANWTLVDLNKVNVKTTDTADGASASFQVSDYVNEMRLGVSKSDDGVYSVRENATSVVGANSVLRLGSNNQENNSANFYLGNINNSGVISLEGSSTTHNVLGTINNLADPDNPGAVNITGGTINSLNVNGGTINMTGGTLNGTLNTNSEFYTTNGMDVTFTENSVVNATTHRFWINFTAEIGGGTVTTGSFRKDVNLLGVLNFTGDGINYGDYGSGKPITQVNICGKSVNINEINFNGGFYYREDGTTGNTIDYGNRISSNSSMNINKLTYSGSESDSLMAKQFLYILNNSSGGYIHIGSFEFKGSDDSANPTQYSEARINSWMGSADVDTLSFTGFVKSRSQLDLHGTDTFKIGTLFAEAAFYLNHQYNSSVATYKGSDISISNFETSFNSAGTSEIRAKTLTVENATIENASSGDVYVAVDVFESAKINNLTLGSDTGPVMVMYLKGSTHVDSGETVDNRDTFSFGNVTIKNSGVLQAGGYIKDGAEYNVTFDSVTIENSGSIQLGYVAENVDIPFYAKIGKLEGTSGNISTYVISGGSPSYHTILTLGNDTLVSSLYGGAISEPGSSYNTVLDIIKEGTNTQILSGWNNFKGSVEVKGGTLFLSHVDTVSSVKLNGGNFGVYGSNLMVNSIDYISGKFAYDFAASKNCVLVLDSKSLTGDIGADSFAYSNISEGEQLWLFNFTDGQMNDSLKSIIESEDNGAYSYIDAATGFTYKATYAENGGVFMVDFSYVIPEPAEIGMVFGFAALAFVAMKRRRS